MLDNAQIWIAMVSGLAAGLMFYLAGRMVFARKGIESAPSEDGEPGVLPRAKGSEQRSELSPEAQAFIQALQAKEPAPKQSDDRLWVVDIWDSRKPQDHARGLPH